MSACGRSYLISHQAWNVAKEWHGVVYPFVPKDWLDEGHRIYLDDETLGRKVSFYFRPQLHNQTPRRAIGEPECQQKSIT